MSPTAGSPVCPIVICAELYRSADAIEPPPVGWTVLPSTSAAGAFLSTRADGKTVRPTLIDRLQISSAWRDRFRAHSAPTRIEGHMKRQWKPYLLALGFLHRNRFSRRQLHRGQRDQSPRRCHWGLCRHIDGERPAHGFVLSREGVFTTIDYPAAASTFAWGMNSHGDVLGS
jgi:hypothetical protein